MSAVFHPKQRALVYVEVVGYQSEAVKLPQGFKDFDMEHIIYLGERGERRGDIATLDFDDFADGVIDHTLNRRQSCCIVRHLSCFEVW